MKGLITELAVVMEDFVRILGSAGLHPRITSTYRTHAKQAALYRRFLAGLTEYTVAAPGNSPHEYGYAFDLIVQPLSALDEVGKYFEDSYNGVWGGRFGDPVHFEHPAWNPTLRRAQRAEGRVSTRRTSSVMDEIGETLSGPVGWFLPFPLTVEQAPQGPQRAAQAILQRLGY